MESKVELAGDIVCIQDKNGRFIHIPKSDLFEILDHKLQVELENWRMQRNPLQEVILPPDDPRWEEHNRLRSIALRNQRRTEEQVKAIGYIMKIESEKE